MWVTHERGVFIIAPKGYVTDKVVSGYDELENLRREVAKADENEELLVIADMTDVTFMNSTGLGLLITAYVHTLNRHGRFAICSLPPRIALLLHITKVEM